MYVFMIVFLVSNSGRWLPDLGKKKKTKTKEEETQWEVVENDVGEIKSSYIMKRLVKTFKNGLTL